VCVRRKDEKVLVKGKLDAVFHCTSLRALSDIKLYNVVHIFLMSHSVCW
jgi:hypothetical protein